MISNIATIEQYLFLGFEHHIDHDHNLWHYLAFTAYLKLKEKTELTGPEQYVAEMVVNRFQ